jgi:hypothetical protein
MNLFRFVFSSLSLFGYLLLYVFKLIVVQCLINPTKCFSYNFCNASKNFAHTPLSNIKNVQLPIVFTVQATSSFSFANCGNWFSKHNIFPRSVTVLFFNLLLLTIEFSEPDYCDIDDFLSDRDDYFTYTFSAAPSIST